MTEFHTLKRQLNQL